jgi:hypothetical protein
MIREDDLTDNLDELLDEQDRHALTVTLERSPRGEEYVHVTPFAAGRGCSCQLALDLKRGLISSTVRTGETRICCGKRLAVVEIEIADETVKDLFTQLAASSLTSGGAGAMSSQSLGLPHWASAGMSSRGGVRDSLSIPPVRDCDARYSDCMNYAQDDFDMCMCENQYRRCRNPRALLVPC